MKIIEYTDGAVIRQVLVGMVTDPIVLAKVALCWDSPGMFSSKWANVIGELCVKYWRKYARVPGPAIETRFRSWGDRHSGDEESLRAGESFLATLSQEYENASPVSSAYLIDMAGDYFNRTRIRQVAEESLADIDAKDIERAHQRMASYTKIEMGATSGVFPLEDAQALAQMYAQRVKPIIRYDEGLDYFYGGMLRRGALISFVAPEKTGKTTMLLDMAWRAIEQKRRVAFFSVGDETQDQMMQRFAARATGRPFEARSWPLTIRIPTHLDPPLGEHEWDMKRAYEEPAKVTHDEIQYDAPPKEKVVARAFAELAERIGDPTLLYLECRASATASVDTIKSSIEGLGPDKAPDVIVIDYADLLVPPTGPKEMRDRINGIWVQLCSMAQTLNCLIVTATQASARSYDAKILDRSHFSEDKRKLAHVTGMIGINVTAAEKAVGVARLNWIGLRNMDFDTRKCCYLAGCMAIGSPTIKSTFS